MKPSLQPGASRTSRLVVDTAKTVSFMGEEGRVYATPCLIGDIEIDLPQPDPGARRRRRVSSATEGPADQRHPRPDAAGLDRYIAATVTAIDGRKVSFSVTAKDEIDTISTGTHMRFVVDKAKTVERLKAKAAKLRAG